MADTDISVEEKINRLRAKYVTSLEERFLELNQAYISMLESQGDPQSIQQLEVLSHTLCGSAGSFGFGDIAAYCKKTEQLCQALNQGGDDSQVMNEIATTVSLLEEAILKPTVSEHNSLRQVSDRPLPRYKEKLIYLLDDEKTLSEYLATVIESAGYTVACFQGVDEFLDAVQQQMPEIMVVDINLNQDSGTDMLSFLYSQISEHIPSIVISASDDFETRMSAVRAGADAFLAKPLDAHDVIDTLDCLVSDQISEPYRVLIIDDIEAMSSYYRIILERSGINCRSISQPGEILTALEVFRPELILMDLHMPECRGDELAKLIQQDRRYFSIPIIYLSSEASLKEKQNALRVAGDGFLNKPIRPSELVEAIRLRARRYRKSRKMLQRDPNRQAQHFPAASEA